MEGIVLILIIIAFILGWFAYQFMKWTRLLVKSYIKANGLITTDKDGNRIEI